jgi:hypothetical protein
MRILSPLALLTSGILSLCSGCATTPPADSALQPSTVRVYQEDPFVGKGYDIMGRIWTDSWRSSFRVPTYGTKDAAIASMQTEAARLNADALISVSCVDQQGSTWSRTNEPAFLCYGVAIKLKTSQG